jgi:rod shape-determining protein MreB
VTEASLPVGGDDLDAGIRDLCLRSFDLLVSPRAAEQVKIEIGSAWPEREEDKLQLTGRDISNGMERTVVLTSSEVAGAIAEPLRRSVRAVANCIVDSPPDLANDLVAQGIHLVGEAGQLDGYAKRLATSTGIPVHLSASPGRAAVVGAARCAQELKGRSSGRSSPRRPGGPASRGPRARG